MTQKTGSALAREFTGLSFFNDFHKSSSHKQPGLNRSAPWLGRGRGVFGEMREAKGEGRNRGGNEIPL